MVKVPDSETIRLSAIAHLRELGSHEEADLLSRCKLEIGDTAQPYSGSAKLGLNIRCRAVDLAEFEDEPVWDVLLPSAAHMAIQRAIKAVLPAQLDVHDLSARSLLVDRKEFEKTELERLVEAQIDLMIAVATGGPRIQSRSDEYKQRREVLRDKLQSLGKRDPNPFPDLWAWYARWSSGDLPSYRDRREYVRAIYHELLEDLAGAPATRAC